MVQVWPPSFCFLTNIQATKKFTDCQMVQQQFFAKDLSFPVNKGRILMGTSGNTSKSFGVVGTGGGEVGCGEVRKWAFHLRDWYLARKKLIPSCFWWKKAHMSRRS